MNGHSVSNNCIFFSFEHLSSFCNVYCVVTSHCRLLMIFMANNQITRHEAIFHSSVSAFFFVFFVFHYSSDGDSQEQLLLLTFTLDP